VPLSDLWDEAEIAVTSFRLDSGGLVRMLLELAAQQARQRGCDSLVTMVETADAGLLPMLASIGETELDSDIARIDISDLSRASFSPPSRAQSLPAAALSSFQDFWATSVKHLI
jgi:hypothetical protein